MKIQKKIIAFALFFPILSGNIHALTLDEAVSEALANNHALKAINYRQQELAEALKGAKSAYNPTLDLDYSYDSKYNKRIDENKHDSALNLTLSYNLFNGFADKYNIKSVDSNYLSSQFAFKASSQDNILATKTFYIAYLQNKKNVAIQVKTVELFKKQYEDTNNFYKQGVQITLNNLLEVEIILAQAGQVLRENERLVKISKKALSNHLGGGLDEDENIEDIIMANDDGFLNRFDVARLTNRSEIRALKSFTQSLLNRQKALTGNYYPKIDLGIQHKRYGDQVSLNGIGGSFEPQNIAALTFSWNLYNGGNDNADIQVNRQQVAQAREQTKEMALNISLQYEDAKEQYLRSSENLVIYEKNIQKAKINYEIVSNNFQEGIASSTDVIDANVLLNQSSTDYYAAYYKKLLDIATLERIFEK